MDLSELKDKMFIVGASQADRNKCKFLASTVRGPYTFEEMCEQVGVMWRQHQHHAKATILEKDPTKPAKFLDENTTDYIEANYEDIIVESMLGGVFDQQKEYTCKANLVEAADTVVAENPQKMLEEPKEETTVAP
jgi:hypothetical protein